MQRVCYYITGHGLGHATRSIELIRGLLATGKYIVHVVSCVKERFFLESLGQSASGSASFFYYDRVLDAGAVQADVFQVSAQQSLKKYHTLIALNHDKLLTAEVEWLMNHKIGLVLVDATPLGCIAGQKAGAKVVMVTNFTWDTMYREMFTIIQNTDSCPDDMVQPYTDMIEQCTVDVSHYDLFIQYPGKCPTHSSFDKNKMVEGPLITRMPKHTDKRAFKALNNINEESKVLLLGFGGHDMSWEFLRDDFLPPGWVCLLLGAQADTVLPEGGRFRVLDFATYTPDYINISDAVLGKLGYGFVSECISCGTPLIYVPRIDWPEQDSIESLLCDTYPAGLRMRMEDFTEGNWGEYLTRAAKMKGTWTVRADQDSTTAVQTVIELIESVLR